MDTEKFAPVKGHGKKMPSKSLEVKFSDEKSEKIAEEVEIKQSVIDVPKSKTVKLKVPGMRGTFGRIKFMDDFVSEMPVGEEDVADFQRQFPNASVEFIEQ